MCRYREQRRAEQEATRRFDNGDDDDDGVGDGDGGDGHDDDHDWGNDDDGVGDGDGDDGHDDDNDWGDENPKDLIIWSDDDCFQSKTCRLTLLKQRKISCIIKVNIVVNVNCKYKLLK